MTREYENWKNRSTNKNEQLLKIQHYIKVRLLHDRHPQVAAPGHQPHEPQLRALYSLIIVIKLNVVNNPF